jgi:hypothetical protein
MLKPLKFIVHSKLSPAIFILIFAAAGLVYLRTSHATTPVASVQVEAGNRTTNATLVSDTTASAGSAVKFNAAASGGTGGGVCNNPFASTSVAAQSRRIRTVYTQSAVPRRSHSTRPLPRRLPKSISIKVTGTLHTTYGSMTGA